MEVQTRVQTRIPPAAHHLSPAHIVACPPPVIRSRICVTQNRSRMPGDWNEPVVGKNPSVWTLHRQTSLPSGRGVCLFFSSCMGPQTTMTGSNLAGHRLLGSARRAVLRTALLARRGALRHPSTDPHHLALRASSSAPDGAQTPFLMERRSAPSGGGQCRAVGPAGGIGEYPSGLFTGSCGILLLQCNYRGTGRWPNRATASRAEVA